MAIRIPPQVIDTIREKTSIVNVISQYVQLRKTGKNYSGLCPFHSEKTPSFTVAEDKQIYYCFGCSKGGNVFQFFQDLEGISFLEAVKRAAQIEQIPFSYEIGNKSKSDKQQENSLLLEMYEKAATLYHHLLINTEVGQFALSYLENRGMTEEIITTFQIGFAPDDRNFLAEAFSKDLWSEEDYLESGLFTIREDGRKLSRFHNRIMFPIRDEQGRVIAFSGRILNKDKDQAKYLNSPETKLFNKSRVLYNFDLARATIRKTDEVFLFEGFMDVIAAWSAGIKNGVASMGTSFNKEQLTGLSRVVKKIVIAYDGDFPGQAAIQRAIGEIQTQILDIQVLLIPELLDPDAYVQKYGQKAFYEFAMHGRSSVFEFQEKYLKIGKNLANEAERVAYIHEILDELSQVTSVLEREAYLNKIVKEFPEFSLEVLREQLEVKNMERYKKNSFRNAKRYEKQSLSQKFEEGSRRFLSVRDKAERMLLFWMIQNPRLDIQKGKFADFTFHSSILQQLYESYLLFCELQNNFCEADFLNFLKDAEERNTFSEILLLSKEEIISDEELAELLETIKREKIKHEIEEKILQQQTAKRIGNIEQEMVLAVEIINLKRKI
ncbi:MAG: DNA primase [Lactobacillales bacterium]|jgi:DNA primase|nr:DNA primase [Lactobacillales bacterium]